MTNEANERASPDSASTEAEDGSGRADEPWDSKELIEAILKVSGAEEAGTSEMVLDELKRLSNGALRKLLVQLARRENGFATARDKMTSLRSRLFINTCRHF